MTASKKAIEQRRVWTRLDANRDEQPISESIRVVRVRHYNNAYSYTVEEWHTDPMAGELGWVPIPGLTRHRASDALRAAKAEARDRGERPKRIN